VRRENRLVSEAEFRRVRHEGRSWAHPLLVIHAHESGGVHFRAGISVGKRVGGAVRRNLLKRRVRELLRARLRELSPGWDVVISPRPPADSASFAALGDAIDQLLRRARLRASAPSAETPSEPPAAPPEGDGP
jgi:ribonuclease P protein component